MSSGTHTPNGTLIEDGTYLLDNGVLEIAARQGQVHTLYYVTGGKITKTATVNDGTIEEHNGDITWNDYE